MYHTSMIVMHKMFIFCQYEGKVPYRGSTVKEICMSRNIPLSEPENPNLAIQCQ